MSIVSQRRKHGLRGKDKRIRDAIKAHLEGVADYEGRTSLEELIAEVNAAPGEKPDWEEVVVSIANTLAQSESNWWPALEFFCVMTELKPSKLTAILESAIATDVCTDPKGRSSIYSLLGELGLPPTAQALDADEELKRALPVQWLDLILPVLPSTSERQNLVAEAIEAGNLTLEHFAQRLDDMRMVGGRELGDWLSSLRDLFPYDQRSQYEKLVEEIFGRAQNLKPAGVPETELINNKALSTVKLPEDLGWGLIAGNHILPWKLDESQTTHIISNQALSKIQLHTDLGGHLSTGDYIIVLAREFLDYDILFQTVLNNIKRGIRYFYILDVVHIEKFRELINRLYANVRRRTVNEAITVLFVRPEMTINNYVLLAYGTQRQLAFSAMIYAERPFAWLRQESSRAADLVGCFKTLVASVALSRVGVLEKGSCKYVHEADQIMDYSVLGRELAGKRMYNPEDAQFELEDTLPHVHMPANANLLVATNSKVTDLEEYLQRKRSRQNGQ